jgi:hypothetical protein
MKKSGFLLIFVLISFISFSQEATIIWLPEDGRVYGDKMQITVDDDLNYIENQFIGPDEGDITGMPRYFMNGFEAPANLFEWQDLNNLYVSQLSYPNLVAEKYINAIILMYETANNNTYYDTAEYYYSKPVLECVNVNGDTYSPGMLVVNPESLSFEVVIKSSLNMVPASQVIGNDFIAEAYQVIDGGEETPNVDFPDTRFSETTLSVDISTLGYGVHEIELFVKGKKASQTLPDEFSERINIRIVLFDFAIQGDDDFSVCKCDSAYFLTGLTGAEGGIFSGECVMESSNVFNPTLTENASTTITYSYPVDGTYYPLTRTVNFDPLPVISLEAQTLAGFDHEVCGFEHSAVYELQGSGYASTEWVLPGEIIKKHLFEGNSKVTIDWAESGDGEIIITATSDKGCKSSLEHMVHIGYNKAPEDSAYVTLLDKMLFCDADTSVIKVFYWFGIIDGEEYLYPSNNNKPYHYLGFLPEAGNSFFVRTAKDQSSCTTDSHIFTVAKALDDPGLSNNDPVRIFPNPTNGNVSCEFIAPYSNIILTVTNLVGQETDRIEYSNISKGDVIRLETEGYEKGIYFLNFSSNSISGSYKLIVY